MGAVHAEEVCRWRLEPRALEVDAGVALLAQQHFRLILRLLGVVDGAYRADLAVRAAPLARRLYRIPLWDKTGAGPRKHSAGFSALRASATVG